MTKQEIEKAANECADSFGSMEPCIAKIKQDVAVRAFVIGATMVNEKQPYTPADMEAFAEYLIGRNTEWITKLQRNETAKTLIELWEKEMRKKED